MALDLYPSEIYRNLNKFKDLDMYSDYGFYEAYDYDDKNDSNLIFTFKNG